MTNNQILMSILRKAGDGTITGSSGGTSTHTQIGTNHFYSSPELLDVIVTPSSVELVYKRQLIKH